ncbi:MAG TPA: hypothetical protein VF518_16070, partial [Polyangia bacterium]
LPIVGSDVAWFTWILDAIAALSATVAVGGVPGAQVEPADRPWISERKCVPAEIVRDSGSTALRKALKHAGIKRLLAHRQN